MELKIKEISSKYDDIEKVMLFGYRARGDNKRANDILIINKDTYDELIENIKKPQ